MTEPSVLTFKFKIFQKVELIDLCSERLIYKEKLLEFVGLFAQANLKKK